jgi:hypothetical protein
MVALAPWLPVTLSALSALFSLCSFLFIVYIWRYTKNRTATEQQRVAEREWVRAAESEREKAITAELQRETAKVWRALDAAGAIAYFFLQFRLAQDFLLEKGQSCKSDSLPSFRDKANDLHATLKVVEEKGGDGWLSGASLFLSSPQYQDQPEW